MNYEKHCSENPAAAAADLVKKTAQRSPGRQNFSTGVTAAKQEILQKK